MKGVDAEDDAHICGGGVVEEADSSEGYSGSAFIRCSKTSLVLRLHFEFEEPRASSKISLT